MTRLLTLLAAGPLGLGLLAVAPPAQAGGEPPYPQPDAITVAVDSYHKLINLGANDLDYEGDVIRFAGTADPGQPGARPPGVGIFARSRYTEVFASSFPGPMDASGAVPGVYEVVTFMNDGTSTARSTLTITVLPSPGDAVTLTRKKRPGRVLVRNDNAEPIEIMWGSAHRKRPDDSVAVPAHSATTVKVQRRSLVVLIRTATEYALDIARGLGTPRRGALEPGLEPKDGIGAAYAAPWVAKRIELP